MTKQLIAQPKRLLAVLVTLLVAAGVVVGSGATFTSQTATAESSFKSGTLTHSNSKNGLAVYTGANMRPGDVVTGTLTIKNTGSLDGRFKLTETEVADEFTSGVLSEKIVDSKGTVVYEGTYGDAGSVALGTFDAGESRDYSYTITFAKTAGNADQGKSAAATYTFDAETDK